MFYEFRELTPIGRRGDEMIRRLADRLVAVDLLDQASELLQYQIDRRLEGAARAQVAARLAMVYLMNRKPDRAIGALRTTRIADLSGELRQQRLLLEARAQSDIGRHDLALDIITNISGREAIRLRSDIYLGGAALARGLRTDRIVLRRSLARLQAAQLVREERRDPRGGRYALAEDAIGLARFPRKICAADERRCRPRRVRDRKRAGFRQQRRIALIARMAASVDTLDGFLREMRTRFPDATAQSAAAAGHRQGGSGPHRFAAEDHRIDAG